MNCFPCMNPQRRAEEKNNQRDGNFEVKSDGHQSTTNLIPIESSDTKRKTSSVVGSNTALSFCFKELATGTQNFKESNLIGEGGFGKVFKGHLKSGQVVAIKLLNQEGLQGTQEYLVEVLMLIMLRHQNLVSLIGFCMDEDERALVYEYMSQGSLENHLFDLSADIEPLEWNTRIKITVGAAKGIEYLHDIANPPIIYQDLKSANILLDDNFNPKLSDFGLAKLAPVGDRTHVSTRVMGTYGYCAPDYAMSGRLTTKSDIYSFGVLLLELITGRRAFDSSRVTGEQNLIVWSRPFLHDRRSRTCLADPLLQGRFPIRPLHQLTVIASMCLQEHPRHRPIIRHIVVALEHVASQPYIAAEVKEQVGLTPSRSSSSPSTYDCI